MIRYEPTKKGDKVKVTFVAPENSPEGVVAVVGDFNDWIPRPRRSASRVTSAEPP